MTRTILVGTLLASGLIAAACGGGTQPGEETPAPQPQATTPASAPAAPSGATRVVFLGTGTPLPDPDRSGPATAVVVNDAAYLFDAGPGVVRRAMQARRMGTAALDSVNLRTVFLTHLHSDHTMGLPDLILTPWVMGRQEPLELYGPAGSRVMVDGIRAAWAEDIDHRLNDLQPSTPNGHRVNVHEIGGAGEVFKDANVTVTAIPVDHGAWRAFGYRIQTPDRTIVISGDARPSDALTRACDRCDLLIFEVYTMGSTAKVTPEWQAYRRAYHTSTEELAAIARVSRPGRLVLYHRANPGCDQVGTNCGDSGSEEEALREMRQLYDGVVVEARDLDVF
jgi:ribonuclease BN (tRNA processing enzyme)